MHWKKGNVTHQSGLSITINAYRLADRDNWLTGGSRVPNFVVKGVKWSNNRGRYCHLNDMRAQ